MSEQNTIHPAGLPVEKLLADCETRRQRRSGPGGQHRNKVETAVVLTHLPTGISAEANERRSQKENQEQATRRLRVQLALKVRTISKELPPEQWPVPSSLWQSRCAGGRIKVSHQHEDFPALLAEVLDLWSMSGHNLKAVGEHLKCSTSQLVKFLKTEPHAFTQINTDRQALGLAPLK
ncbi:MAG: peptide chain release factor-like protein [Planctomycetaceae bacterium]|nr:peptide chain release factor-like protein [Planctomycetaceae bacterium]